MELNKTQYEKNIVTCLRLLDTIEKMSIREKEKFYLEHIKFAQNNVANFNHEIFRKEIYPIRVDFYDHIAALLFDDKFDME